MSSIISENLKKYRKLNKLTQQEMAQYLFVTPQAVSKWERGESLPDISLIPNIAKLLKISIADLWEDKKLVDINQLKTLSEKLKSSQIESIILKELKLIDNLINFPVDFDFFLFLNETQKENMTFKLLKITGSDEIIEDFLYYLPNQIKEKVILQLLEEKRHKALENLIPMMSKDIRTKVLEKTLLKEDFDFLDELFPFLNHDQKEFILRLIKREQLPISNFDNYLTFFTEKQREILLEGES